VSLISPKPPESGDDPARTFRTFGRVRERLFDVLLQRQGWLSEHELQQSLEALTTWDLGPDADPELVSERQWYQAVMRTMLRCATQRPSGSENPSKACQPAEREAMGPGWVRTCRCLLAGSVAQPSYTAAQTPIALCDVDGINADGLIYHLEVELLPEGGGCAFPHPRDCLLFFPAADFRESLERAFAAACRQRRHDRCSGPTGDTLDACWRLLDCEERPIRGRVHGSSASGAAALLFYQALGGQQPDAGLLVLAELDAGDELGPVEGVDAKARAAVRHGGTDKIVVASRDNQLCVEQELERLGCDTIRVEVLEDPHEPKRATRNRLELDLQQR